MLKGNKKKLDKNKDGKIYGEDFKLMKKPGGAVIGALALGAAGALGAKKLLSKRKKTATAEDDSKNMPIDIVEGKDQKKTQQQMASKGKMIRGFGAARTSGMGLQDEQLVPGKSLDYYKDIM